MFEDRYQLLFDGDSTGGEPGGTECTQHTDADGDKKCDTCGTEMPANNYSTMIIFGVAIVGIVIWMFFSSRKRKRQEKEEREQRDSIAVGDEVTTIGGIIGKIVSVKGETFVLETTKDKTKIRFLKSAISSVDVKASDIVASMLETKVQEESSDTEENRDNEPAPMSKRAQRKARRLEAEAQSLENAEEPAKEEIPAEEKKENN